MYKLSELGDWKIGIIFNFEIGFYDGGYIIV